MTDQHFLKHFIAGGVGGLCLCLVGHPFDTIKVRLQSMPIHPGRPAQYAGTLDCFKQTIAKDGIRGLYKGMAAPLISITPLNALFFTGCALGKWLQQTDTNKEMSLIQDFNAGALAGVMTTIVAVPTEHIKCLLQVQTNGMGKSPRYKNSWDAMQQLYKEGGVRSIYRGTGATLLRDIPASAVYLGAYEYFKHMLIDKDSKDSLSVGPIILAGAVAGMASWIVCLPADVLKSRLQTAPVDVYPNGIRDAYRELVRNEGYAGLFRGFVPTMIRSMPTNAACFLGVEMTLEFLHMVL